MPQRETQVKGLPLTTIGGVNQRIRDTELSAEKYSTIEGVFPEFAGLQSRIWGKRLHKLYGFPIYSIVQMWTPYGYGAGFYQFEDNVDFGYWLTPSSQFDLTLPTLPIDGGLMTLDEFGNPYGSNFGYGTDNTCVISFLNRSSNHTVCNGAISNVATPDDTNGSPAGQGTSCHWELGNFVEYSITAGMLVGLEYGTDGQSSSVITGPLPYPIFPSGSPQKPSSYTPGGGPFGVILLANVNNTSAKYNLGFGNWNEQQQWDASNSKATINFAPFVNLDALPTKIEFKIRHNGGPPYTYEYAEVRGLTFGSGGNYLACPIEAYDYMTFYYRIDPTTGGFAYRDFIVIEAIRTSFSVRVCS